MVDSDFTFSFPSYTDRLTSEMLDREAKSGRIIEPHKCFVASVNIIGDSIADDLLNRMAERWVTREDLRPSLVYITPYNQLYFLFYASPNRFNQKSHAFEGNQQKICSFITSKVLSNLCSASVDWVDVQLIEFTTKTQIFAYFAWKTFETTRKSMKGELAKGGCPIPEEEEEFSLRPTMEELSDRLSEAGIDWEHVPKSKKHGVFLKRRGDEVCELSEMLLFSQMETYLSLLER